MTSEKDSRHIDFVDGANSCNDLIRTLNRLTDRWEEIYDPIQDKKKAALKSAGLDKTPGANFEHCVMGMFLALISDCGVTMDDLTSIIKFKEEAPFFEIKPNKRMAKFETLIDKLTPWVMSYIDALGKLGDVSEQLGKIPGEAADISKNAPSEFADLEFMAKAKMIKSVVSTVSKIKNVAEDLKGEMNSVQGDLNICKATFEKLKEGIDSKSLMEQGNKCKSAKKVEIKDCYELAFGAIKKSGGGKEGGSNGCCTIF